MTDETPDTLADAGQAEAEPELSEKRDGETVEQYVKRMIAEALAAGKPADEARVAVPQVEHPPQTPEEVLELGKMFAEYRAEVAALRQELAAHRPRTINVAAPQETLEQRQEARLALIAENSHYCPGCGKLSKYPRECVGTPAQPHKAIEMVPTDELGGDPARHAKAPSTDPDQPDLIAA